MVRLLLLLVPLVLIPGSGLITAEDPIDISGQLGSDILLPVPVACITDSYRFDISNPTKDIGMYDGGLQPMTGYEGRLTFNAKTCTITLSGLTKQDGTRFTVNFYKDVNRKLTRHAINYRINVSDPLSSPSYTRKTTQSQAEPTTQITSPISTVDHPGFALLCLSLDMTVNALFPIVLGIMHKFCEWKLEGDGEKFGYRINSFLTFLLQTIVFSTMYRGNSCGLLLVLVPIILLIDTLIGMLKYFGRLRKWVLKVLHIGHIKNSTCKKNALRVWGIIRLLIQLLFPVFVGLLCYIIYDNFLSSLGKLWYWLCISLVVSFAWKAGVFFVGAYCYKCKRQRQSSLAATEETENSPDDPIGIGEVKKELLEVDIQD